MPAAPEYPDDIGSLDAEITGTVSSTETRAETGQYFMFESSDSNAAIEDEFFALTPYDWDPTRSYLEEATPLFLQRITNDITDVIENPPAGIYAAPHEDDIDRVHALVVGNAGTPYEGGFFHFLIQCPPEYPVSPPRVRLMNTDGDRITFHPYLHETGRVLLDMLGNGSTTAPGGLH
ncbi:hypothetical protein HPB51_009436 [Rhipicephalus microplus]|uniref:Ubiquitin-conjugating enzyme E2 Z n=1 Tax=Rhipicephalus microplus TaxID=6941 RepID=A0A9J6E0X9_RHIMP|nr:hypothetical protein HPB51_009436 [Rhipicephalus microplus]